MSDAKQAKYKQLLQMMAGGATRASEMYYLDQDHPDPFFGSEASIRDYLRDLMSAGIVARDGSFAGYDYRLHPSAISKLAEMAETSRQKKLAEGGAQ